MEELYYAIAFNLGWLNDHNYVLEVGSLEQCLARAEEEQIDRGGKYAVGVYARNADPRVMELIDYFPSARGEDRPDINHRLDAARNLGLKLLAAHRRGVELPDSLRQSCEIWAKTIEERGGEVG